MKAEERNPLIRHALLGAVSSLAVLAVGTAAAQDSFRPGETRRLPTAPGRSFISNWSLDARATYSDNFRRLSDERARFFRRDGEVVGILVPRIDEEGVPVVDADGIPIIDFVPTLQLVDVEPPDNVILSASLRGATVYERAGLSGIVSGGVRVGTYANRDSIEERLLDTVDPNVPRPDNVLPTDTQSFGLTDLDDVFVEPDIAGAGTVRLKEDLFYLDASAVAQQQALSSRNNLQAESAAALDNRVVFAGGSLSPYLFRNVAAGGSVEARYRYTGVFVVDENLNDSERFTGERVFGIDSGQQYSNDSSSHEGILEYRSGDLLDRIDFRVAAIANKTIEDGSDVLAKSEIERLSGEVQGEYEINRIFSATASFGYDDVSVDLTPQPREEGVPPRRATQDDLSGFWFSVGGVARPSRRSRLSVAVGDRFGGTLIEVDGRYQPSPRIILNASADRRLDTGTQSTFRGFGNLNSRTLNVLEQLTSIQGGSAQRLLDQVVSSQGGFDDVTRSRSGAGAYTRYALTASYILRRTTFSAGVSYSQRDLVGADGETDDNANSILNLNAQARRQVSRRLSINARARYQRNDGRFFEDALVGLPVTGDRDSTQLFGSVGAAYQVGRQLSVTGQAYHSERSSGGTRFDYEENAVSAGLRWTF